MTECVDQTDRNSTCVQRDRNNGERQGFFIVGAPRSGTTLLRAMLNAHPHIAIPFEADLFSKMLSVPSPWERTWARHESRAPIEQFLSHPAVRFWGVSVETVLEAMGQFERVGYPDIIQAIYQAYAMREGKPRWGDKTPIHALEIPQLSRAFPQAQFIHLVRDGRDVYLSWTKLSQSMKGWEWAQGLDAASGADKWQKRVWFAARHGRRLGADRYYELWYEDLVRQPETTLQSVCRFLGERYDASMLRYYEHAEDLVPAKQMRTMHAGLASLPDPSRLFQWKVNMSAVDVRAFELKAGATLLQYGYAVSLAMRPRALVSLTAQCFRQRLKDWWE
ncbi:MAG: sulfotransferase [Candidatus Omnitrophota bacterium]|nr:sulfotransferase [Candidatus Omnitrophota bacterium]